MKAPRKPEPDPKQDAESVASAPASPEADPHARGLDELFGAPGALGGGRTDAEIAASRDELAALFGHPHASAESSEPRSDPMTADLDAFFAPYERVPNLVEEPGWEPAPAVSAAYAYEDAARAPEPEDLTVERAGADTATANEPDDLDGVPQPDDLDEVPESDDLGGVPEPDDESAERARGESVVLADTGAMLALFGLGESNTGLETDDQPSVLLPDDRADAMPEDDLAEASAGDVSLEGVDDAGGASSFDDGVEVSESEPVAGAGAWGDHTDVLAPVDATEISPLAPTEVIAGEDRVDVTAPEGHSGALAAVGLSDVFAPAATTAAYAPPAAATEDETLIGSTGSFQPARRRGVFAWSKRVRWSVAASVVLLVAVVVASVMLAQTLAANDRAAQAVAASVAELESAEADATEPYGLMEAAIAEYDAAVLSARAAADGAAPALASVAGMADETALAAANAALAALVAQLDTTTPAAPPGPYERGDVDMTDVDELAAATQTANQPCGADCYGDARMAGREGCARREGRRAHGCPGRARIFAARDRGDHRRCEPAGRAELPRCGDRCVRRRGGGPGRRRLGRCRTARVRRGRDRAARG